MSGVTGVTKKRKKVEMDLLLKIDTIDELKEIARLADVTLEQVINVILATKIREIRKAGADTKK